MGLHARDVSALLDVLDRLVKAGNSVLVIEHNPDIIRLADYIIDLGPEGGEGGGEVIFAGSPKDIVKNKRSHTGRMLLEFGGS